MCKQSYAIFIPFSRYLKHKWSYWSSRGVIGPPPSAAKFGHAADFFNILNNDCTEQWKKDYGKQYGLYMGTTPILFVSDIDLVRQVCIHFLI